MTLNNLMVDSKMINGPSQFSVAIGRATAPKDLEVVNFRPSCVVKPQLIVRPSCH